MDEKFKIQLGSEKNIKSVTVDTYGKIGLTNKITEILEYDIRNVLSVTEVFEIERSSYEVYRIYGRIEYLSILNGLNKDYEYLSDFFSGSSKINGKEIFDSFSFYLLKPYTAYTEVNSGDSITYARKFEVIATQYSFELFNAGYTKNVYDEQVYSFDFNVDIDVSTYLDAFNMPPTQLFLYAEYNRTTGGLLIPETMSATTWNVNTGDREIIPFSPPPYHVGSIIYGDKIQYDKAMFLQTVVESQEYYINTSYRINDTSSPQILQWKYNPFIPFQLRYFSNELKMANTGTTSYDQATDIPYYATEIEDGSGNMVWRDILPQGYFDPLTGIGVDYPFINKNRYLFSTIILDVTPNLDHTNTAQVFREIKFADPTTLNFSPLGEINDIGKPC